MADRVEAASVGELAEGEMKPVEVGDRTAVLLNVEGRLYAIDDECTHEACSLLDGDLEGEELECVCHGSMFNVRTGEVLQGPAELPIPTYAVELEGDTVYVTPA